MWRLWAFVIAVAVSAAAAARTGKITGVVIDEYGIPVPHMNVEACPADVGFDMIVPSAETDEKGRFALNITFPKREATDRWAVYAYDEDERPERQTGFYARPSDFFGNKDPRHYPVVQLSPKHPDATAEVTLPAKAGALKGKVLGTSGIKVVPTFELTRVDDPKNYDQYLYEDNRDPYRILVPANTSVSLEVTSPGYKPWKREVISVGSGDEVALDIQLELEDSSARKP